MTESTFYRFLAAAAAAIAVTATSAGAYVWAHLSNLDSMLITLNSIGPR